MWLKRVDQNKNASSAERTILINDAQTEKYGNENLPNCKGPHVACYKGCPEHKQQAFRQYVANNQTTYASIVSQNTLQQPKITNERFTFTAKQLTKFIANVAPCTTEVHEHQSQPSLQTHLKSSHITKIHLST